MTGCGFLKMDFDRAAKNVADVINSIQQFSAGDQEALQDVIEDYFTIPQSDNSSENYDSDDDRGTK